MRSFYLIVSSLVLVSIVLLGVASAFPDLLAVAPMMSNTASDVDADASKPVSGFDGFEGMQ